MLAQPVKKKIPILMFHSISQNATPKFKPFTVSPVLFARQMAYLHQQAYSPITVTQFIDPRTGGATALPERPVGLTFDARFPDCYLEALPLLPRYRLTATMCYLTAV